MYVCTYSGDSMHIKCKKKTFKTALSPQNRNILSTNYYATFNNISAISWQLVLLVEETRVLRENHRPLASH